MSFSFRENFPPMFLWRMLIYNSLIALILIIIRSLIMSELTFASIVINFIYSQFIGWSVAFPLQFITRQFESAGIFQKSILVFFSILFFGAFGALAAYLIVNQWLYPQIEFVKWWQLLIFNLGLAFFFGLLALVYFNMRYKLEKTINVLKEKEIEKERLKQLQKATELEALRAKIEPHFLFNTLNSIAGLIKIDPDIAEKMIERLSALFRYTLRSSDRQLVSLDEELKIVKHYLEIETLRLGDRLKYKKIVNPDIRELKIPPLIIQPLVENAIKHGIARMKQGGLITIKAEKADTHLHISVEDNGGGFNEQSSGEGYGLRLVKDRLKLAFNENQQFKIESNGGVKVIIVIPCLEDINGLQ